MKPYLRLVSGSSRVPYHPLWHDLYRATHVRPLKTGRWYDWGFGIRAMRCLRDYGEDEQVIRHIIGREGALSGVFLRLQIASKEEMFLFRRFNDQVYRIKAAEIDAVASKDTVAPKLILLGEWIGKKEHEG